MRVDRFLTGMTVLCAVALFALSCGDENGGPVAPTETPPRAPEDLHVTQTGSSAITIAWRDLSSDELGFRIERSVGGTASFAERDTVPRDVTTYTDTQLQTGITYYYRVRSYRANSQSEPAEAVWGIAVQNVTPTVPRSPVPADQSRGVEEGVVTIAWTSSDPDAGDPLLFDVYFGESRNALQLVADAVPQSEWTLTDRPVSLNASYFWRVIAHDSRGATALGPIWSFNTRVERIEIPAGWLVMGEPEEFEHPGNPVWVDRFEIDKFEVTNQQYAVFLNAMLRAEPTPLIQTSGGEVYSPDGLALFAQLRSKDDDAQILYESPESLFVVVPGKENFPVMEVTWQGAVAFAEFFDRRLPTEAEWEMAARGNGTEFGSEQFTIEEPDTSYVVSVGVGRTYPWGQTLDANRANFLASGDPFEGQGRVQTTPVGFFDGTVRGGYQTLDGSSPFGVRDLGGNVSEWTADWYAPYRDPHAPPSEGLYRIIRGGSWRKGSGSLESWRRDFASPYRPGESSGADRTIGFRTVRSLP
ncbi:MAG: SUMF1/EgtB/PvdO family nonheme iron enzyme [Candidatus Eisenbacteria bacterium]|nr:SUMF1/EgtB/PvdO family nonheme iron enzyme [Candidatus Latescibacterota bacterium]MBD3303327.1 SUMF1/EgtB/PvdO family nonheme iron enzyme [Candidatus Eisenbacteria bacterium]